MGLNPSQLKFIADYIQEQIGIVYTTSSYYQLENRLDEVVKVLNLSSTEEFFSIAQKGLSGRNKQVFLDIATNNETSFFRDPNVFTMLQNHLFPDMLKVAGNGPKRIWSCACSFGQEPYSLSMIINELLDKNINYANTQILTTDISEKALEKAKSGKYTHLEVQRGLSVQRMLKNFKKNEDESWTINDSFAKRIQFQKLNLLDSFSNLGQFDMVLCRNVLIYQTPEKKKDIIARICKVMKPQACLVLGGSESLIGLSDEFHLESYEKAIYFRKK